MKGLPWHPAYRKQAGQVLAAAEALQAAIPAKAYDFDRAKAAVMTQDLAPVLIRTRREPVVCRSDVG